MVTLKTALPLAVLMILQCAAGGGKMSALSGELPREVGNVEGRVQECVTVNM